MRAITRRDFMRRGAAAGAVTILSASHVRGANDRIRIGLIGCGGRGIDAHIPGFAKQAGVTIVAVSDPDKAHMAQAAKTIESKYGNAVEQYRRHAQAAGPQGHRRDFQRHDAVLARPEHDLGLPGRQARLRGEAAVAFHLGRPADGQRRAEVQPPRAVRHAAPLRSPTRAGDPVDPRGPPGQDQVRHLLCQQAADLERQARRAAADPRHASTTTSGAARPARSPSTATSSNTIAASTGTWATASRATRASTRSTWPAGSWARTGCRGG